jgi:MFS family permease
MIATNEWAPGAVFWVNVPIGVFGTIWAYRSLRETSRRQYGRIDWPGNITFAVGAGLLLIAITYGIQPHGGRSIGWANPWVLGGLVAGVALLAAFCVIETKVAEPMFQMGLFKIRAFAAGSAAALLAAIARGGLQFMLIIWLQGVWLPQHGYGYEQTPLWAGIYLLPLTTGFLISGPVSGHLSDRFGARPFTTGGLLVTAATFSGLMLIPVDFPYWLFALLIFMAGIGQGMFASPNTSAIMSSVPASQRGVASGMRATFQNSGTALSIGIFFSLMILGLAAALPATLAAGLHAQAVPLGVAARVAHLPPVSTLFAAFLGINPIGNLLGPSGVLRTLPPQNVSVLTGKEFFPHLISQPFHHGRVIVFSAATAMSLVAALVSLMRGAQYYFDERPAQAAQPQAASPEAACS